MSLSNLMGSKKPVSLSSRRILFAFTDFTYYKFAIIFISLVIRYPNALCFRVSLPYFRLSLIGVELRLRLHRTTFTCSNHFH